MRLLIGLLFVFILSYNAPPSMPGFIQFLLGFGVMFAVYSTFRPKEPDQNG